MSTPTSQPEAGGSSPATFVVEMGGQSQATPSASLLDIVKDKLARKLWATGSATLVVGVGAGLHKPADGSVFAGDHKAAYYGILAGVLAAAAVEMATAFWLPRSSGRGVLAFASGLLPCAVVILLLALAVGGFGLTFKA